MTTIEFALDLKEAHIFVERSGGSLKVKGNKAALTPEIRAQLAEQKTALLELLGSLGIDSTRQLAPTTFSQQRLWFIDHLEGGSAHYNMPSALRLHGSVSYEVIERAMNSILARHETLRTTFVALGEETYQVIHEHEDVHEPLCDLSAQDEEARMAELQRLCSAEVKRPFALDRDRMMRWQLIKLADDDHVLLRTCHHIASDGWSMGVLNKEFTELCQAYDQGQDNPLEPLVIQYSDYAHWQRNWLKGEVLEEQLDHWLGKLENIPSVHSLPLDRPRPASQSYRGESIVSRIGKDTTQKFNALCKDVGATAFMGAHAAFSLLLSRYSGETDIVMGTPIANREQPDVAPLCGFFLNTLVLRSQLANVRTFRELLDQSRQTAWDAYAHQQVPFEQLATRLGLEHSLSYAPVFQIMLIMQNNDSGKQDLEALKANTVNTGFSVAKFDIELNISQSDGELALGWNYAADLFDMSTIGRMALNFEVLLSAAVANPDAALDSLIGVNDSELEHCTRIWNDTAVDYAKDACLNELFEDQVEASPDAIALVAGDLALTYAELNKRANQLAHYLIACGVRPNDAVGISLGRCDDMARSVLGVLKAGATYLPIDTTLPKSRAEHICTDASLRHLIVRDDVLADLCDAVTRIELTCADVAGDIAARPTVNPDPRATGLCPTSAAYAIYTSGSTGLPKGVSVSHANVHAYYTAARKVYDLSAQDRILQLSSFSFDIFTEEFFGALLTGAALVLRSDDAILGGDHFWSQIEQEAISVTSLPTAFWHQLCVQMPTEPPRPDALRLLIIGGEAMSESMYGVWREHVGSSVQLLNTYGPTETTVIASTFDLANYRGEGAAPIGSSIANSQLYVFDKNMSICPVGVHGELCTGGDSVSRGYIGKPALTAERFVPDPYASEPGARMYRTGDVVFRGQDGELHYVGRQDGQIKIRGFRIETGEIEAHLLAHPDVSSAVVVAHRAGGKEARLVAYVVAKQSEAMAFDERTVSALRQHCASGLPPYMTPSAFVLVEGIPLTPLGKVDTRALPEPDLSQAQGDYTPPEGALETELAQIWADILSLERVGRLDSFFEIGGHSLLATQLATRIRDRFGAKVNVRDLFECPTIALLAERVAAQAEDGAEWTDTESTAIARADRNQPLALSYAQKRLWFLSRYMGANSVYNIPFVHCLPDDVDLDALMHALAMILNRHEALRTRIDADGDEPCQIIEPVPEAPAIEQVAGRDALKAAFRDEANFCFDLKTQTPCRLRVFENADAADDAFRYALIVNVHHIAFDGWSSGLFFKELVLCYEAAVHGASDPLPELTVQYADFAAWQQQWLGDSVLGDQLNYWKSQLAGAPDLLDLPTDRPRPPEQTYAGAREAMQLSPILSMKVKELAQRRNATLYMALLSAFGVLLSRYSGQKDLVIGTPVAGRTRQETEQLIGFFANTMVMRCDLEGDPTFEELLGRVRSTSLDAFANQDIPFEMLVESINPKRDPSYSPIFQVMFVLQTGQAAQLPMSGGSAQSAQAQQMPKLALSNIEFGQSGAIGGSPSASSAFDITLGMIDTPAGLQGDLEYNTDLFDASTIRRFLAAFRQLLQSLVDQPDVPISQLALLDDAAARRQTVDWNMPVEAGDKPQCLHERFEQQVQATPDAVAVIARGVALTFSELNARAERVARSLAARGIGPESRVGVMLERSVDLPMTLMGVLKAGAAYVPLDPAYPAQRLAYLMRDSAAPVVLVEAATRAKALELCDATRVEVVELNEACRNQAGAVKAGSASPQNLAYVIYTSGSTGKPKGVGLSHANADSLLQWAQDTIAPDDRRIVLASTSVCFDLSVYELFLPLTCGGTVCLVDNVLALGEGGALPPVDLINTVPSAARALVDGDALPASVHVINLAGEPLRRELVDRLYAARPDVRVYDLYGPSEDTTYSTWQHRAAQATESIGVPIDQTTAFVLDESGQVTPLGVPGELYLGGAGLTRGYLGRPALTAEKYVPNPFSLNAGERLYRTGDIVRYRASDDPQRAPLEYIGRRDHQVKVRGFRIELGEIEVELGAHPAVADTAVLVCPNATGAPEIVAYVVDQAGAELTEQDQESLRSHLAERLPKHMLPDHFVSLAALPLTANGKVDRAKLGSPQLARRQRQYVAPQGDTEQGIAQIWRELLGLEQVGRDDVFFDLGGHSLLAIKVLSRLRDRFAVELSIRDLFRYQVLAELAKVVDAADKVQAVGAEIPLEAYTGDAPAPLSFTQQRLWFLSEFTGANAVYNMPVAWRVGPVADEAALVGAVNDLIARHDTLRTAFTVCDGQPSQVVVADGPAVAMEEMDDAQALQALCAQEARHAFDLSGDLLCRIRLIKDLTQPDSDDYGSVVLLFTMHHAISDGWSLNVLRRDLRVLYFSRLLSQDCELPELSVQYSDYARWQRASFEDEAADFRMAYWRRYLKGVPELLQLPTDRPRPPEQSFAGGFRSTTFSAELTERLNALAREHDATLYMTVLAAFSVLLGRVSGQSDLAIGTPVANRVRAEVENLIGFFANTLVVRTKLGASDSFVDVLRRVKEDTLQAFAYQDVPFESLVDAIQPVRNPAYSPLFQVMFTLRASKTGQRGGAPAADDSGLRLRALEFADAQDDGEAASPGVSRFDLTLALTETEDGLSGGFEYATALFDEDSIDALLASFDVLLNAIVETPSARIADLAVVTPADRAQQLEAWSTPAAEPLAPALVHERFATCAADAPDAIAVVAGAVHVDYATLKSKSDAIAAALAARGIGRGDRIGVCISRSVEQICAVVGAMQAGAAWLPLDPEYPDDRLAFLVADSDVAMVLVNDDANVTRLAQLSGQAPLASIVDLRALQDAATSAAPAVTLCEQDLAYVIYTSGSTGRPKGVCVSHRAWANLVDVMSRDYELGPQARMLKFASLNFDASVMELSGLATGATLCLLDDVQRSETHRLSDVLELLHPTHACPPPAILPHLDPARLGCLTCLIVGGDVMSPAIRRDWSVGRRLFNGYGPTESTVMTTAFHVRSDDTSRRMPPIGSPLPNLSTRVLDAQGQLLPRGAIGELYIGGRQLAQRYLNRPALTAERFVPNPFAQSPGERLYKSGDLVRYAADGTLNFVGRSDQQVQLRGVRIEPGEIQDTLLRHASVRDVAVVLRDANTPLERLVAYAVPAASGLGAAQATALMSELDALAAAKLPATLRPAAIVVLDALPLTPNGKLDRQALPEPESNGVAFEPPSGPIEDILAEVWCALLRKSAVGRQDNFFRLGGHSLLVTVLAAKINQIFKVDLSVRDLFDSQTLAQQASAIEQAQRGEGRAEAPHIDVVPRDAALPLSYGQQRLWFLHQYMGANAVYNVTTAYGIAGDVDVQALCASLNTVLARHEVLRTHYVEGPDGVHQVVVPELLVASEQVADAAAIRAVCRAEERFEFDLTVGPLCRLRVLQSADEKVALVVNMHHSICDGWSMSIFFNELAALYAAAAKGDALVLPELPVQYADYAAWQRSWLSGERRDAQLGYWRGALEGLPPLLTLPTDRPRPARQSFAGGRVPLRLGASLSARVTEFSRDNGVTPFMTLHAALSAVLARLAGQSDVAVATPVANRTLAQVQGLIGFFVNTLVLRTRPGDAGTFAALVEATRDTALAAYANQDIPFEMLVEDLKPARSLGHSPLFQVMLSVHSAAPAQERTDGDEQSTATPALRFESIDDGAPSVDGASAAADDSTSAGVSRFDLTVELREGAQGYSGSVEYNSDIFEPRTVARFMRAFTRFLAAALTEPQAGLATLSLLDDAERVAQIEAWNPAAQGGEFEPLHVATARHAQATPDKVALEFAPLDGLPEHLTFAALDERADELARALSACVEASDAPVGLCVDRSLDLVVGVLGIGRAGAAYVPLDPTYPQDRLALIVASSGLRQIVTTRTHRAGVVQQITADADVDALVLGELPQARAPYAAVLPENLAYVIYTSGSTGVPKGVGVAHGGWSNLARTLARAFSVDADSRMVQFASLNFDAAAAELCLALGHGGTLCLLPYEQMSSPALLAQTLARQAISHATLPPVVLGELKPGDLPTVTHLVVAGEAISADAMRQWASAHTLINAYGPTETTVCATAGVLDCDDARPNIGRPLDGLTCFVHDEGAALVPCGVVGELFVGGPQVARGYLGQPALTAERFVPDPYSSRPGARLYATGDRCRWVAARDDAPPVLEYTGRADDQVKIRGFRVEPGELAHQISTHAQVENVAVVVADDEARGKQLIAYVSAVSGYDADALPAALNAYLAERVPAHLMPAHVVALDTLPLTSNGKVDRAALPAFDLGQAHAPYAAPEGPTEEALAELWVGVLGASQVGRDDNFFTLGGHSLLATRLLNGIEAQFNIVLGVRSVFEHQTLRAMAAQIDAAKSLYAVEQRAAILPVSRDKPLRLSSHQDQLWYLNKLGGPSAAYNVPLRLTFKRGTSVATLARCVNALIERHEVLRTRFVELNGIAHQVVDAPWKIDPESVADAQAAAALVRAEVARPMDLTCDSPVRIRLLTVRSAPDGKAGPSTVLFVVHHSLFDGVSAGILQREFATLFKAFARGEPDPLPALDLQFADYANWQRYRQLPSLDAQRRYWQATLADAPATLALPVDRSETTPATHSGGIVAVSLGADVQNTLARIAREQDATMYMAVLAAYAAALRVVCDQSDVVIGSQVAVRDAPGTQSMLGFFVNTLLMRCDVDGSPTLAELIRRVKETSVAAFEHQQLPLGEVVARVNPKRAPDRQSAVPTMLTLHTQDMGDTGGDDAPLESLHPGTARFDLSLSLSESARGLVGSFEYSADLYDHASVERLATEFVRFVRAWCAAPQTPLGELDGSALLAWSNARQRRAPPSLNPGSNEPADPALGNALHDIWCAVLDRDGVDPTENFFSAGGHSLLLPQLAARVERGLGHAPALRFFLEHQTIAAQAAALARQLAPTEVCEV